MEWIKAQRPLSHSLKIQQNIENESDDTRDPPIMRSGRLPPSGGGLQQQGNEPPRSEPENNKPVLAFIAELLSTDFQSQIWRKEHLFITQHGELKFIDMFRWAKQMIYGLKFTGPGADPINSSERERHV